MDPITRLSVCLRPNHWITWPQIWLFWNTRRNRRMQVSFFLFHTPDCEPHLSNLSVPHAREGHSPWGTSLLSSPLSCLRIKVIFLSPPNSISIFFNLASVCRESQDFGGKRTMDIDWLPWGRGLGMGKQEVGVSIYKLYRERKNG